ncbi:MAG TPA: monooxygenase [Rugosimonospora sp.]|nr:monooxygenase [Rugosimonospora sp.]
MRHVTSTLLRSGLAGLAGLALLASCASTPSTASAGSGGGGSSPASSPGHATYSAPPAQALRAGEHFETLRMAEPYQPVAPNGGTDEYRCFLVDPKITKMSYLTGSQFLPDNVAIVHHAIFFRVSPQDADKARQADAASPGEGWTCFGDADINADAAWVAQWAPGSNETLLRQSIGYPMPPGSLLIMQVHYNLLATGGKPGGVDQSSIRLRLADGSTKMTALDTATMTAPVELPCATGESGPLCDRTAAIADVARRFGPEIGQAAQHLNRACNGGNPPVPGPTQHCDHQLPPGTTIYAVAGHMHLLGRSITLVLNPGTPNARTLLDVPSYNFDDQAIRPLAQPVTLKAGDTLRVTCTHDASLRKLLPQLRTLPPRYVVWGDGTSDEMCLALAVVSVPGM